MTVNTDTTVGTPDQKKDLFGERIAQSRKIIELIHDHEDIEKLGFSRITFIIEKANPEELSFIAKDTSTGKIHGILINTKNKDGESHSNEKLAKFLTGAVKTLRVKINILDAGPDFLNMLQAVSKTIQRDIKIIDHDTSVHKINPNEITIGISHKEHKAMLVMGFPVEYTKTKEKLEILMKQLCLIYSN
jgi:hypothetical protein